MKIVGSDRVKAYYAKLEERANTEYDIARKARAKGYDPSPDVEIPLALDVGARVEGLVGPKGVAEDIRAAMRTSASREEVAKKVVELIASGKYGKMGEQELAEQCIRSALALITEGVVAAPIEGISAACVEENPDGSRYLSVYFAGPIRSAGGTAQALAVVIADFTRTLMGLENYRPTDTEVERYVEEIQLYHSAVSRLQYAPTDDEIRHIVRNCPVCITGDPTAQIEVNVHKELARVKTNRIRGGMCLVIGEGIAQKAAKVLRLSTPFDLNWGWLQSIVKVDKAAEGEDELKPDGKYLQDIVAGRPILSYPSTVGGFRPRYGRARNTGLMAKGVHPASMIVLGKFLAVGTQLKLERPGKGAIVTPCDSVEGPVVKLKNGSVMRIDSTELANMVYDEVEEILFNGDLLISYGDFLHSNHRIFVSPYVEEWWVQELEKAGGKCENPFDVSVEDALALSEKYGVPLHPLYTFPYNNISLDEMRALVKWLATNMEGGPEKRSLERIFVPHKVENGRVVLQPEYEKALVATLGLPEGAAKAGSAGATTPLELVNSLAQFEVRNKAPMYIGARMGRPEKAKERMMSPAPHLLFPVGNYGGNTRSLMKAYDAGTISIDVPMFLCEKCNTAERGWKCSKCGSRTVLAEACPGCGRKVSGKCRSCGMEAAAHQKASVNVKQMIDDAIARVGKPNPKMKGVKGTMSKNKMFEPIEKGIIRSRNNVYIFKDGTIRYDSTNLPLTHFKPSEIGTSVERLRELGYLVDAKGQDLVGEGQVVELFPQDIVVCRDGVDYLLGVTHFLDELLDRFYGLPPHFKASGRGDLVGQLIVLLAPHTSAGVLGRIIGFSKARGCYMHPYYVAASRRDCDGDEGAIMFLLDALINFSKEYLPASRGGRMDAPLVLTLALAPSEVDDQVHEMETFSTFPLDFYEKSSSLMKPADFDLPLVRNRLDTEEQYDGFGFTHSSSAIDEGITQSAYTLLDTMPKKVDAQLGLGKRIMAVNEMDEAKRLLNSHFLRDIYGNLRAFGEQKFRCVACNAKFRRVPLVGKCTKCGGKIILTVAEGSVRKYLAMSKAIAEKYSLSSYISQRLMLVESSIDSVFLSDKSRQYSLSDFL